MGDQRASASVHVCVRAHRRRRKRETQYQERAIQSGPCNVPSKKKNKYQERAIQSGPCNVPSKAPVRLAEIESQCVVCVGRVSVSVVCETKPAKNAVLGLDNVD